MVQVSKEDFKLIFPTLQKHYNKSGQKDKSWRKTTNSYYIQENIVSLLEKLKEK